MLDGPKLAVKSNSLTFFGCPDYIEHVQDVEGPVSTDAVEVMREFIGELEDFIASPKDNCDKQTRTDLMEIFVSQVVGKAAFDAKKSRQLLKNCVTDSDEALAILLLLNSAERWISMHEHGKEDSAKWKQSWWSTDGKGRRNERHGGWNKEGMIKCTEIQAAVKAARNTPWHNKFEKEFLEKHKEKLQKEQDMKRQERLKKVPKSTEEHVVLPDDLDLILGGKADGAEENGVVPIQKEKAIRSKELTLMSCDSHCHLP